MKLGRFDPIGRSPYSVKRVNDCIQFDGWRARHLVAFDRLEDPPPPVFVQPGFLDVGIEGSLDAAE